MIRRTRPRRPLAAAALAGAAALAAGSAVGSSAAGPPTAVTVSPRVMHRLRNPAPVAPVVEPVAPPANAAEPAAEPVPAPVVKPKRDVTAIRPGVAVRDWSWVVLHHTATGAGDVASIHAEHRERVTPGGVPWRGIGYHFLIGNGEGMPDGAVEATFRWKRQLAGAHAGTSKHNDRGVGVCLVGDFTQAPPTPAQLAAASSLIARLRAKYDIPPARVVGHGTLVATACPGELFSPSDVRGTAAGSPGKTRPPLLLPPSGVSGTHDAP